MTTAARTKAAANKRFHPKPKPATATRATLKPLTDKLGILDVASMPPAETREAVALLRSARITSGFYYHPSFPVNKISVKGSGIFQVRATLIDQQHVDNMKESARNDPNITWPAIVLLQSGSTYIVLDGNHRLHMALQTNRATLPAIIVNLESLMIRSKADLKAAEIAHMANTKHGKPSSHEERLPGGAHLVTLGSSIAQAAVSVNVPENKLRTYIAANEGLTRANQHGVGEAWEGIAPGTQATLSKIKMHSSFREAVKLVSDANLGGDATGILVREVNKIGAEKDQAAFLAAARKSNQQRIDEKNNGGVKTSNSPYSPTYHRAAKVVGNLSSVLRSPTLAGMFQTKEEIEMGIEHLENLRKDIAAAMKVLRSA